MALGADADTRAEPDPPNLPDPPDLTGRVAIVTGASRGIGRALAVGLAEHGARVVCAARSLDRSGPDDLPGTLAETVAAIADNGGDAIAVRCDIGVADDIEALVARTLDHFGRVDILVNNAMTPVRGRFAETTPEMWDDAVRVNVRSLYVSIRAVLGPMIEAGGGSIVNMSSGAAASGVAGMPPGFVVYSMVKAAMERLTTALAVELTPDNIAVNALRPGAVRTEKSTRELGEDYDWTGWRAPESVVPSVLWLAAQDGAGLTGQIVDATQFGVTWPTR